MSSKEHKWWAKVRSAPLAATAPASPGIPTTFIKKMVRQHVGAPIPTTITAHELRNAALSLRLVAEDPTPCADLPIHVIGCILHKALDAGFTRECLGLMHMCRAMRDMCLSDEGITTKLFATIGATPQPRSPRPLMEQFAMAYSGHTKTCFFCKAGGLRRVHDDLGDFCACASCLQDNTVVHFDLQKTLLFTPELLDRLPFYAREYCGGSWRVTMHISLFSDADRLCREHFGMSLPERGVEAARILAERASARAAASRERARDRRRREAAIKRLCKAKGITGIEALPSFKEARNLHTGVPSDEELMEKAVPMLRGAAAAPAPATVAPPAAVEPAPTAQSPLLELQEQLIRAQIEEIRERSKLEWAKLELQRELAEKNLEFQREEAEKDRAFKHEEAEKQRAFEREQAKKRREGEPDGGGKKSTVTIDQLFKEREAIDARERAYKDELAKLRAKLFTLSPAELGPFTVEGFRDVFGCMTADVDTYTIGEDVMSTMKLAQDCMPEEGCDFYDHDKTVEKIQHAYGKRFVPLTTEIAKKLVGKTAIAVFAYKWMEYTDAPKQKRALVPQFLSVHRVCKAPNDYNDDMEEVSMAFSCICGKTCQSKGGLSNHKRVCAQAKAQEELLRVQIENEKKRAEEQRAIEETKLKEQRAIEETKLAHDRTQKELDRQHQEKMKERDIASAQAMVKRLDDMEREKMRWMAEENNKARVLNIFTGLSERCTMNMYGSRSRPMLLTRDAIDSIHSMVLPQDMANMLVDAVRLHQSEMVVHETQGPSPQPWSDAFVPAYTMLGVTTVVEDAIGVTGEAVQTAFKVLVQHERHTSPKMPRVLSPPEVEDPVELPIPCSEVLNRKLNMMGPIRLDSNKLKELAVNHNMSGDADAKSRVATYHANLIHHIWQIEQCGVIVPGCITRYAHQQETGPAGKKKMSAKTSDRNDFYKLFFGATKNVGKCAQCKREVDPDTFQLSHIVARSNGGSIDPENVLPLCGPCNLACGQADALLWMDRQ
ncbi:hypothetical protein HXX76_014110 [Chlamydomonas incerta]|uniref:HNH nuclease domain-containing protein n=1 Tax=Chlamydomonas incerta TaxID=51695 RepID=A0A835SHH1_CHLIN|nr:hypothetical protein HXX76_014110 [Chlamydomonas incerta]|eukprot:KAG2424952.1 hypothetical protein HXX76_014110 [Chlamydomonas incerta]